MLSELKVGEAERKKREDSGTPPHNQSRLPHLHDLGQGCPVKLVLSRGPRVVPLVDVITTSRAALIVRVVLEEAEGGGEV